MFTHYCLSWIMLVVVGINRKKTWSVFSGNSCSDGMYAYISNIGICPRLEVNIKGCG